MFSTEARDLELLRTQGPLRVPRVLALDHPDEGGGLMLMEFLEAAPRRASYWEDFGAALARLHGATQSSFGLEYDNHIGSLPQSNRAHATWAGFFAEERLRPQVRLLAKQGGEAELERLLDRLRSKLESLFPPHPPALLHGDLWSGNVLVDDTGGPAVIDPAAYYGHPEMDLAFTQMFGRFPRAFYEAYAEHRPLEPGFEERCDLYNLYPLLVHANLFGGGYVQDVYEVFRRFA